MAEISQGQGGSGGSHVVIASPAPALQLVSNSKTFYRVEEPRTWKEAMRYCQERYTDLADLQSVNSPVSIMVVYSYLSSTQAWIGLFYDVRISGLSWSSGSIFTTPDMEYAACLPRWHLCYCVFMDLGPCPRGCLLHSSEALHLLLWCVQINVLGLFSFLQDCFGMGERKRGMCVYLGRGGGGGRHL